MSFQPQLTLWCRDDGLAMRFTSRRAGRPAEMLDVGWIDAVRRIHPEKGVYTYWNFSYQGGYDRSSGLRMDHLLVSPSLAPHLRGAGVDVELRRWEKPSDHAPAWIEFEKPPTGTLKAD